MKKSKFSRFIVFVIAISICLSTIVFAGGLDVGTPEGVREDTRYEEAGQESLVQSNSAVIIQGNGEGGIGNPNAVGDISYSPETGFVRNDGNGVMTPIGNVYLVDSEGTAVAELPGAMGYNETTGEYSINIPADAFPAGNGHETYDFTIVTEGPDGGPIILSDFTVDPSYTELNEGDPSRITVIDLIFDTYNTVVRMIERIVNDLFIPLGDGILYLVFRCVGEVVTIDGLIFGEVNKVSIDYFDSSSGAGSIKAVMSPVVNKFYGLFYQIAIIVYMMMLVVTGIQIMLQSTANKSARYKEFMVSWLVGVCILLFFPFVMKYTIKLNTAVVTSIKTYMNGKRGVMSQAEIDARNAAINDGNEEAAWTTFGNDEFVKTMMGETAYANAIRDGGINAAYINDTMILTRVMAQKMNRFVLTVVYFIFIGQTIVVLIMYYKRAFMLAFLITIFPLVAMTYALDKVGDKKAQSFGIWFKEFIVNVIVQMFHAVVFALLVGAGMKSYVDSLGKNWLFLILCILFLFQGEKILRNIFNVKSSANTLGDMAATGLMAYGAVKQLGGLKGSSEKGDAADEKDAKDATARQNERRAQRTIPQANTAAAATGPTDRPTTEAPQNQGQYTGNDPEGVENTGYDGAAAKDTVLTGALRRRLTKGAVSKAANFAGKSVGTLMGATYGMSKGDTGSGILGNAIVGAVAGKAIGEGLNKPAVAILNKAEQAVEGERMARRIEGGEMDNALTLANMPPPEVDENQIIGEHGETMQEIYRQALAEMTRVTSRKGRAKGELAYWTYIDKHTKKD